MSSLPDSPAWRALAERAQAARTLPLEARFAADPARAARFSLSAAGLHADLSKQAIDDAILTDLLALAAQQRLPKKIARLFAGEPVNPTEGRAAAHFALRMSRAESLLIDGHDVIPEVHAVLDRMVAFADRVRDGRWRGATGRAITDVVNIGIGGSDSGPRMVWEALAPDRPVLRAHFVANIDGAQLDACLRYLDPATTLFVVTSKTFTTQETMTNAAAARCWLVGALGEAAVDRHFVAVSTNAAAVAAFGIGPEQVFGFWDWVGGRYSLWSAVGLVNVIALGPAVFRALLAGARAMDDHFRDTPLARNLPVLMGLLSVWNRNFLGRASQVVIPYTQRLAAFVGWLQQLEMESNGKGVDLAGRSLDYLTTPVLWGDVGSNAQHAFFQMLHQGPEIHAVDFILPIAATHGLPAQQPLLIANCLAQSAALMRGKPETVVRDELAAQGWTGPALEAAIPHRTFPGNRPSTTLLLPRLDAEHLGALCALYEHRTYVMSVLWNINAFDQWGVELGKQLAGTVLRAFAEPAAAAALDASTQALIARVVDHGC